jgi:hypothetical protein
MQAAGARAIVAAWRPATANHAHTPRATVPSRRVAVPPATPRSSPSRAMPKPRAQSTTPREHATYPLRA